MTLNRINVGSNDDGSSRWHYQSDGHVLLPGPVVGQQIVVGTTSYDLSPAVIEVDPDHVAELAHRIGLLYEDQGHPRHTDGEPFAHLCTPACGERAREIDHPLQALAVMRAALAIGNIQDPAHAHAAAEALGLGAGGLPPLVMALASVTAENAAVNGLDGTGSINVIPYGSLHTASPGTTGANENANSGSYARQALAWNGGSGGSKTNSSSATWATAGSTAVTHGGTWSSATYGAGNYAIGIVLGSSITAAAITAAAGALSLAAA